jgi:Tfp pilus assembly protein PilV
VRNDRHGFGLLEVVLSMFFVTLGILVMGTSMIHALNLVNHSRLTTERSVAVRQAAEEIRATGWAALEAACQSRTFTTGRFTVTCTTARPQNQLKKVHLISLGPAYGADGGLEEVPETTAIVIAEPIE